MRENRTPGSVPGALGNRRSYGDTVKPGDKVLVGKYAGTEVKLDGTEYVVVREDDIFGII